MCYNEFTSTNGMDFVREGQVMTSTINANFFRTYQNIGQLGTGATTQTKTPDAAEKSSFASYLNDATVEISDAGLNALADSKTAVKTDEEQLSTKAQSYLENLRKKYGDYNFVVSNDLDTSKTLGSDKEYSVILTTEELEKMAEDDEYAQKVMGQVGSAVDMLKDISEKDLGEGVQFSQLGVSFDSEGNMKFFAQLEKLSADQQERLEAAKEKRAEEQKAAEQKAQAEKEPPEDGMPVVFKSADVEASSEEELLAKIFGINWNEIDEEEALI